MEREQDVLEDDLAAVARGDERAFRRLYDAAAPRLFALCLKLLRRRDRAEEALQEAFVRIWQRADRFDPKLGSPFAWMLVIARHACVDLIRRQPREADALEAEDLPETAVAAEVSSDHVAVRGDLARCLGELNEIHLKAIKLAYFGDMTHTELAAAMGVPLGTAKSWLRRGLQALKECLER